MTNLRKAHKVHIERKAQDVEKIKYRQRERDFYDTYAGAWKFARVARYVPSLVSIALAFTAVAYYLEKFSGSPALAVVVAIVTLVFLEAVKTFLIQVGTRQALNKGFYLLLVLAVLPFSLSVLSSTGGAVIWFNETSTIKSDLQAAQALEIDSVRQSYTAKRKLYKEALESLSEIRAGRRGGWLNESERATVNNAEKQLLRIDESEAAALGEVQTRYAQAGKEAAVDITVILWVVVAISLFVEGLVVLLNWFVEFFEVRTKESVDELVITLPNGANLDTLKAQFESFVLSNSANLSGSANPLILAQAGASANQSANHTRIGFKSANGEYLAKYPEAVSMIREGEPEADVLRTCDIGRTTYYNLKRIINEL
jgi:hypothetical protein